MSPIEVTYSHSKKSYCLRPEYAHYRGREMRACDLKSMKMYIESHLSEIPVYIPQEILEHSRRYDISSRRNL